MLVILSDALGTARLVLWRSQVMTRQVTDEEELAIKIVAIGGTGLIGSKSVAILRQGGHEMIAARR